MILTFLPLLDFKRYLAYKEIIKRLGKQLPFKENQHHNPILDKRLELESFHVKVIDDIMVDIYKQKSPLERLKIAFGLWNSARTQLFHNLSSLQPDWDEKKIRREIAKRISHGAV